MTEILKIDREGHPRRHLKKAVEIIKRSGVIAYPTDTFYGLGANPFDVRAVEKIFTLKGREETKPLLLLISKTEEVDALTEDVSPLAKKLMVQYWPGPLTMIFKAASSLPASLLGHSGKIGLRLPNSKIVLKLLALLGHPLTATSANKSGGKNPLNASEVLTSFGVDIELILDGGTSCADLPSTVVDVSVYPPLVIREGSIPSSSLEEFLSPQKGKY